MESPLILLIRDKELMAAEVQALSALLGVQHFRTHSVSPQSGPEHEGEILRLRPARVILPRKPLLVRVDPLPYKPSARARRLAPHGRFVYEPLRMLLQPLEEELARAA